MSRLHNAQDSKSKGREKGNHFEIQLIDALQKQDCHAAKNAVSSLMAGADVDIISKALVQTMYLLWIRTTQASLKSVRRTEQEVLKIVVAEMFSKLEANPIAGLPTAFHYCMQISDIELLNLFFDHGIDSSYSDMMKNTPLHLACTYVCDAEVVRHILKRGDNTYNTRNAAGMTPLMIVLEKFWGSTAHGKDVWEGVYNTLEVLLSQSDIDLNICDFNGRTPLTIQLEHVHSTAKSDVLNHAYKICAKMFDNLLSHVATGSSFL